MADYLIKLEQLKKAGIKPQVGKKALLTLKDGTKVTAKIVKVGEEIAIVTAK